MLTGSGKSGIRHFRLLLSAACLILLAGCSLRITYPLMDWWIKWQAEDYVSFNSEQKQLLDTSLERFHQWHQATQLSVYASQLEAVKAVIEQDKVTPQQLLDIQQEAQQHWLISVDYLLPDIEKLFLSLDQQQWQEFQDNLVTKEAKKTKKMRKASTSKRYRLRQKNMEDRLEDWFGRLTPAQDSLLKHWSQQLHPLAEVSLQEQREWLKLADQLYQQRLDLPPAKLRQAIRDLIIDETRYWNPQHQQWLEENRQHNRVLLSQLHDSLTDRQRQRLTDKLTSFQRDLEYLAGHSPDSLAQRE